jgi:hypothetical protein
MLLPVAVARSGLAELAVVSVMVVRRPADDGGRAVGQREWPPPLERGAAAVTGTRVRAGSFRAGSAARPHGSAAAH